MTMTTDLLVLLERKSKKGKQEIKLCKDRQFLNVPFQFF